MGGGEKGKCKVRDVGGERVAHGAFRAIVQTMAMAMGGWEKEGWESREEKSECGDTRSLEHKYKPGQLYKPGQILGRELGTKRMRAGGGRMN